MSGSTASSYVDGGASCCAGGATAKVDLEMAPPDVELVDQLASPSYIDDQEFDEDQDDTANMTEIIADAQRAESNASSTEQTSKPTNSTNGNSKPNAKDPLRPRRKKARRACLACQRAHLTCGEYFSFIPPSGSIASETVYHCCVR